MICRSRLVWTFLRIIFILLINKIANQTKTYSDKKNFFRKCIFCPKKKMTLKTLIDNSFNGFRKTHSDDFKRTNTLELKKLEEEFQLKRDFSFSAENKIYCIWCENYKKWENKFDGIKTFLKNGLLVLRILQMMQSIKHAYEKLHLKERKLSQKSEPSAEINRDSVTINSLLAKMRSSCQGFLKSQVSCCLLHCKK